MLTAALIAFALLGLYALVFNGLATAVTKVEQGWSGIEVQLKRRHDLTPQLVAAVRGAMRHEEALVTAVLEARTQAIAALSRHDPAEMAEAEGALSTSLSRLIGYAEDTPDLKTSANVETLQRQLEETEDQIAAARRLYNGNVQNLNGRLAAFPGNLVGRAHHFRPALFFALADSERAAAQTPPRIEL